jgi:hypothetical protein
MIGPSQRPYLIIHSTHKRLDMHAPRGIRTYNPSKGAAADKRLGTLGDRYRLYGVISEINTRGTIRYTVL